MITVQQFMDGIDKNVARIKKYQLGHDGSDGKCDCVGLIIGALRLAGVKYDGLHGSNWFARHYTDGLQKLVGSSQLQVGDVVYKCRPPGSKRYKLPERYEKDPDQNDYYHIGVVKSVYPLCIVHCTSPGAAIHYDSSIGKWTYFGRVRGVLYEGEMEMDMATVVLPKGTVGSTVNMRKGPDKSYSIIKEVPVGSRINVIQDQGKWCQIEYDGKDGWMMSNYIEYESENGEENKGEVDLKTAFDEIDVMQGALDKLAAALGGRG